MLQFVGSTEYSDGTFELDDGSYACFSCYVVAARCPELAKLWNPKEFSRQVKLHGVSNRATKALLEFLYTANLQPRDPVQVPGPDQPEVVIPQPQRPKDHSLYFEMLDVARRFGLEGLKELCQEYIMSNLELSM